MNIPEWAMRLPLNLIHKKAKQFELDECLIAAICWKESRGFVYAVRFEPNFKWLVTPEKYAKQMMISVDTEKNLQMQSYGLTQLMGGTCRWLGFDGALPALFKPENNLFWCCKYLQKLSNKYDNIDDVIASYNAGSPRKAMGEIYVNQAYVDDVKKYIAELKG